MKKTKLICALLLFATNCFAQKLTCSDFKTGTFTVDVLGQRTEIIREINSQIEIWKGDRIPPIREKTYEKIEWVDECSFRITYDESKMVLTDEEKALNNKEGILVELKSVEGNCINYELVYMLNDEPYPVKFKMCKVN